MARLIIKPVTTSSTGWSKSLIVSDHDQLAGPTANWLVTVHSNESSDADAGKEFQADLETFFNQKSEHTSTQLYQFLNQYPKHNQHLSIAALVFDHSSVHILAFGNSTVTLKRNDKQAILIDVDKPEWSFLKGSWQINDTWDIEVGASTVNVFVSDTQVDTVVEDIPETVTAEPEVPQQRKKRYIMILGFVVLAFLITSVLLGAQTRNEKRLQAAINALEQQVTEVTASSQALKTTDQVKARQDLRTLQDSIVAARSTFEKSRPWLEKWEALNKQVEVNYQELSGEAAIQEIPVWFSLSVVRPDLSGTRLGLAGDSLLVLDQTSSTLVRIGTDSKRADVVAGGESITNATAVAGAGNRALLITGKGIVEVALAKKTTAVLIEPDSSWQKLEDIAIYNNNVYLLDSGAGEIWRYSAVANGLGDRQRWLGNGVTLPSGNYREVAVDGDLWLLRAEGQLNRYRRGAPLAVNLSGLDTPLGSNTAAVAVSPDQDAVIIIDSTNQRAVRFTKQGAYVKQLKWAGFATTKDIVLSPDAQTLYILKDNIIYATPI